MPAIRTVQSRRSRRLSKQEPRKIGEDEWESFEHFRSSVQVDPVAPHKLEHTLVPPSPSGSDCSSPPPDPPMLPARKQPEDHIPRPMNAFMLYRSESYRKCSSKPTNLCKFSVEIADQWRKLTPDGRSPYLKKAEVEKLKHARKYPGYKYSPYGRKQKQKIAKRKPKKALPSLRWNAGAAGRRDERVHRSASNSLHEDMEMPIKTEDVPNTLSIPRPDDEPRSSAPSPSSHSGYSLSSPQIDDASSQTSCRTSPDNKRSASVSSTKETASNSNFTFAHDPDVFDEEFVPISKIPPLYLSPDDDSFMKREPFEQGIFPARHDAARVGYQFGSGLDAFMFPDSCPSLDVFPSLDFQMTDTELPSSLIGDGSFALPFYEDSYASTITFPDFFDVATASTFLTPETHKPSLEEEIRNWFQFDDLN